VQPGSSLRRATETEVIDRIEKTDAQWRAELTAQQYRVARGRSTEPAGSGRYWKETAAGVYHCVCCGLPLFSSDDKYNCHSGWPSYTAPIRPDHVAARPDDRTGTVRTEVLCARCGAHLGHVFDDGPKPTGRRYCINSVCLKLVER